MLITNLLFYMNDHSNVICQHDELLLAGLCTQMHTYLEYSKNHMRISQYRLILIMHKLSVKLKEYSNVSIHLKKIKTSDSVSRPGQYKPLRVHLVSTIVAQNYCVLLRCYEALDTIS